MNNLMGNLIYIYIEKKFDIILHLGQVWIYFKIR